MYLWSEEIGIMHIASIEPMTDIQTIDEGVYYYQNASKNEINKLVLDYSSFDV